MSEQQKIKSIKKQLDNFDVSGAKDKCSSEVNTNRLLIEPFFHAFFIFLFEVSEPSHRFKKSEICSTSAFPI